MEARFSNLVVSPVFSTLVHLLDTSLWPTKNVAMFGEKESIKLSQHFEVLLQNGKYDTTEILDEWEILKTYVVPMIINNRSSGYFEICKQILANHEMKAECMYEFKILLITPFTNAKVERMFSRMARIKTNWRNCLGRDPLDSLLRLYEEGQSYEKFDPTPTIEHWFNIWTIIEDYKKGQWST